MRGEGNMKKQMTIEELVALKNALIVEQENAKNLSVNYETEYVEGIGAVPIDYTANNKMNYRDRIAMIQDRMNSNNIITEHNFDEIAVGTAFYGFFIDGAIIPKFINSLLGFSGEVMRYKIFEFHEFGLGRDAIQSIQQFQLCNLTI